MKRPGLIARIFAKAFESMVHAGWSFQNWLLPRTRIDYAREVGDGDRSSVVMAPLFWIARRFAEAKYKIVMNGDTVEDHDILKLLNKPNPYYSGRALRMASSISYNSDGNVYWLKIRNKQLKVVELWYVPHWLMSPHWPEDGSQYIDYYKYAPGFKTFEILPEDVIHIRNGIDPFNTRKGMSPLKSLFREIFTDDEAANFSATLLKNMGVPGLVVSPGIDNAKVTEDDKKDIKAYFRQNTTGDKRGDPVVMSAKTDVKQFGFSPSQLDLGKLREIPEERIAAILGVPAAVVGFGTGLQQTKVGATMREMREAAYEDCIIPMQNLYADELNTQLLPDFESKPDRFRIDFDLSDIRVLQEDENAKSERFRGLAKDCIITQGEARQALGIEAGPEHDVYLLPFSVTVTPAGEMGKICESVAPASPKSSEQPEMKTARWKTRLLKEFNRSHGHLSSMYSAQLSKQFDTLGDAAASAWRKLSGKADIPQAKDDRDNLLASLIVGEMRTDIIDYDTHYLRVTHETFSIINAVTNLMVNLDDPAQARILAAGGKRKGLLDIKGDTRSAIFRALAEAREAGEGADATARRIRDSVAAGPWSSSSIRAKIIARTETKNAQNVSSLEAYRSGGVSHVEIVDGQLPTSDEDCIARNGQVITIAEAEKTDDHPNGTLSFTPVIEIGGNE